MYIQHKTVMYVKNLEVINYLNWKFPNPVSCFHTGLWLLLRIRVRNIEIPSFPHSGIRAIYCSLWSTTSHRYVQESDMNLFDREYGRKEVRV